MTKHHTFPGVYLPTRTGKMPIRIQKASTAVPALAMTMYNEWGLFTKTALNHIWTAYCGMNGNYIAIVSVIVVLVLSLLLPDITQKLHTAQDLKSMKKVVNKMSNDVKRAEAACLTVADEICQLQFNMNDNCTETSKQKLQDLSACTSHCMRRTQSEPNHIENKVGLFRRLFFPIRNTSNKEVTLMSYLYTNSFDDKDKQQQQVA